VLICMFTLNI